MELRVIFLFLIVALSGCSSLSGFGSIDRSDKTMTMPPGAGLTADIRSMLRENGWETMVDHGPSRTTGALAGRADLEHYDTFHTRYRMYVEFSQYDVCIPRFDPAYNFNISIIDNQAGEEVMNYGGRACRNKIIRNIERWLEQNEN